MINEIPISLLNTQAYCEYQIFLERVRGVRAEETKKMKLGKKVHSELEKEHEKKAELELTPKQTLKKSKKEKITLIARELEVRGKLLYGLIDEVHFSPSQIVIIDDKPGTYAYMSNKKQVWGYCLAFEEYLDPGMPLIAVLRNRDTQQVFWEKPFANRHRDMVKETTQRILDILNGKRVPVPTTNANKCRSCRFNGDCDRCNL